MTMNLEKHTQLIYCKINNPYKEISIRTIEDELGIEFNPFLQPSHSNKLTICIHAILYYYSTTI